MGDGLRLTGPKYVWAMIALTIFLSFLMVSTIRFRSFKDLKLQGRVPFAALLVVPVLIVIIFLSPPNVLFLVFLLYACSGLAMSLWRLYKRRGRKSRENLKIGICGEHGGDPASVMFCHEIELDYVSCSPFRVPIARLAAAQAALAK